jgi:HPt (histidine-containing phosphotransfer) domain-containing protein
MDAMLAKPVHMQKLYEVVESAGATTVAGSTPASSGVTPSSPAPAAAATSASSEVNPAPATTATSPQPTGRAVDHLRRSTGGNEKLMSSLTAILLQDSPKTLARIGRAIAHNNAADLAAAAHLLKGSLAIFGASKAVELARSLEAMGREVNLRSAPLEFRALETEFATLREELAPLVQKKQAKPTRPKPKTKPKTKPPAKRRKR